MTPQPMKATPCYLYGFIRATDAQLPPLKGVFDAPVEVQTDGQLSALVSYLPPGQLRASRADLLAHSNALDTLFTQFDVLPASLGTVYQAGFSLDELPSAQKRSLLQLLDTLAGQVEFQVKAEYDQSGITRLLVETDARLKRLRTVRKQDHATQLAIGSRFAELLEKRRRADTARAVKLLKRVADRVTVEVPSGEWAAFRLAILVPRKRLADADASFAGLAKELDSTAAMTWVGPLPPYSFVQDQPRRRAG